VFHQRVCKHKWPHIIVSFASVTFLFTAKVLQLLAVLVDIIPVMYIKINKYCKTSFFACPLFREFREPGKFTKITRH